MKLLDTTDTTRRQMDYLAQIIHILMIWFYTSRLGLRAMTLLLICYLAYLCFWSLGGGVLRESLGLMLESRNKKGQYLNASHLRRSIFPIQSVLGLISSLLFFILAKPIALDILHIPNCVLLLKCFAPLFLVRTFSELILGFLIGEQKTKFVCFCYILRSVLYWGIGLFTCESMLKYGTEIANLLKVPEIANVYGAGGVIIAFSIAELILFAIISLWFMFGVRINKEEEDAGMRTVDKLSKSLSVLYGNMAGTSTCKFLLFFPLILGFFYFFAGRGEEAGLLKFGGFLVYFLPTILLLLLLVYARILVIHKQILQNYYSEERRVGKVIFNVGIHLIVSWLFFGTAMLICFAKPLSEWLGADLETDISYFRVGSPIFLFIGLAIYFTKLLERLKKRPFVIVVLILYNFVFGVAGLLMLKTTPSSVTAMLTAMDIASGVLALVSAFLCFRCMRCRYRVIMRLGLPLGLAAVAGFFGYMLSRILVGHMPDAVIVGGCGLVLAALYWSTILLMHNYRKQEILQTPGGNLLMFLAKTLGLIRK